MLKDGAKLTEAEIRDAVKGKLSKVRRHAICYVAHPAQMKIPDRIFITDSMCVGANSGVEIDARSPKAGTGKVQRRLMAPRFLEIAKNEPVKAKL